MMNRSEGSEHRDVQVLRSPHLLPSDHPNAYRRPGTYNPANIMTSNASHHFPPSEASTYALGMPLDQREGQPPPNTNHNTPNMSPQRYPMYDDSNRRVSHTSHDVSSDSGSMDAPRSAWSTQQQQPSQYVFVKTNDHKPMDRSPSNPEQSHSPHQANGKYILPTGYASTSASPYSPDQSANPFQTVFEKFPSVPIPPEIRPAPSDRAPARDFAIRIAPKRPIESDPDIKLAKLSSRTVTGENVAENNIVDGYVQFVFAHDPMYASDDTDSIIYLKKKILATPKTQDLTYSAWDIYALVLKLHVQELKNWSQLVGELGHTDISTRPQFAQRIKRWMQKYKIDRYFDYLLGNPYSYDAPSSKFSGCLTMGTNHRRKLVNKSDADEADLLTPDGDADSLSSPNKRRKLKDRYEKHEYDEADIPVVEDGEEGHATGEESSIKIGASSDVEEEEGRVVVAGSRKRARGALPKNVISNRPKSSPGFVADDEEQSGDDSDIERDSEEDSEVDEEDEDDEEGHEDDEEDEEDGDEEAEVEEVEGIVEDDPIKSKKLSKHHDDQLHEDEEDELNSSASSAAGSPRWTPSDLKTLTASQTRQPTQSSALDHLSSLPESPKPVSLESAGQLPSPKPSTEGVDHAMRSQTSASPSSALDDVGIKNNGASSHEVKTHARDLESLENTNLEEMIIEPVSCLNCGHDQPQVTQLQKEVQSLRRMVNSLYDQLDKQAIEHRQNFEQLARRVSKKDAEIERFQAWRRQVIDTFLSGPSANES
ncbi:hypothetical protein INT44_007525 [Umbelopsis vinacea]|uniref:Uncharacterized protein n=1 Tax=Umbelopsis vinacea TaxID=44442 RepID=A0A8H7PMX0_9FUNG|nr:hypothetical protein INT44_007525 [Umbelopsis vinacea]